MKFVYIGRDCFFTTDLVFKESVVLATRDKVSHVDIIVEGGALIFDE